MQLYPRVAETLLRIKGAGARIAIYTESQSYYSFYRLKRLGLDGVVDRIYTPPDHEVPEGFYEGGGRKFSPSFYECRYTEHRHTPPGELKPNPDLLEQILNNFGVGKSEALYIGDSLHKDIAMAQDAGVDHAWAKYGRAQETEAYELLKTVTHWTDEDVKRENLINARNVDVDIVFENSIEEIFEHFVFGDFQK